MLITTNAIVLSYKKYKETSLLCTFYTEKEGYLSFIVKGIYGKNKKTSHFYPLNRVELVYQQKKNQESLHFLNSISTTYYAVSIYENPIKITQIFFLTELLRAVFKKEASTNSYFYKLIEQLIEIFDKKQDNFSEFHLYIIVQLIELLGISPNRLNPDLPYFDLINGSYCLTQHNTSAFLSKEEKELFHKIFELNFSQTSQNILSPRERKTSLSLLLKYLSLHIDSFADLISLQVLKQLDV